MMIITRHWRLLGIVTLLAATCALVAANLSFGTTPPPAEEPPPLAPVKWMEARQFFVEEWTEAFGTTLPLPDRMARITAPIEGRVVGMLQGATAKLVEGQPVKKGDIIVQLDATLARANRTKIEASQQELKQLTKQAEFAVKLANIDVMRLEELSRNTSTSDKLPLVSRIELAKAKLALEDAESKAQAAALREVAAKKELHALDEQLLLYTLTAPIDGRLGRLFVVLGQTLSVGNLVADVIDLDEKIDILCFVPPNVVKKLQTAQEARIGAADDPQAGGMGSIAGQVEFIADQAEPDTGNFAVKIRFPNNELKLRSNTTLRVRILTTPGKACLTLPESALFEDQDPPMVLVVDNYKQVKNKDGKEMEIGVARKLAVKIGIRDRVLHLVEVTGLSDPENKWQGRFDETTKFVVEKGRGLRNGDEIRLEVEE